MAAVLNVDSNLHAQLNADIQKELNMELNRLRAGQRVKDSEIAKVILSIKIAAKWASIQQTYTTSIKHFMKQIRNINFLRFGITHRKYVA